MFLCLNQELLVHHTPWMFCFPLGVSLYQVHRDAEKPGLTVFVRWSGPEHFVLMP